LPRFSYFKGRYCRACGSEVVQGICTHPDLNCTPRHDTPGKGRLRDYCENCGEKLEGKQKLKGACQGCGK
jgi:ribonucleotide monophosphatase NagD (HAD superfamily)